MATKKKQNIAEGGFLSGYKSYIIAGTAIIGAIGAYAVGELSLMQMLGSITAALGLSALRDGISKEK